VGNANGKNPVPIIVPCHRVIRADGGLGGFTGGVNLKHQLLNREQASYGTVSNPGDRPA
ncbi:MAG: methylated-DNA--[protein]-cysteine S-methyltransferase, partial [Nitrospinaceae bacterium]|nr:methylated-DNA--[protein]-cysteine S-methyltransferase [Nitrospinaceae bacterium]